jgi:hypothetical protein
MTVFIQAPDGRRVASREAVSGEDARAEAMAHRGEPAHPAEVAHVPSLDVVELVAEVVRAEDADADGEGAALAALGDDEVADHRLRGEAPARRRSPGSASARPSSSR